MYSNINETPEKRWGIFMYMLSTSFICMIFCEHIWAPTFTLKVEQKATHSLSPR